MQVPNQLGQFKLRPCPPEITCPVVTHYGSKEKAVEAINKLFNK